VIAMTMSETEHQDPLREFVRELTEHQAALRAFVGYLMNGAAEAADLTQEVNLLLWEKRDHYELGTNFRAWAFTTARYVVLGYQRRLRRDGLLLFDSDLIECLAEEWQAQADEHERKLAALHCCLEKVPDADLALLRARYSGHGKVERLADETERSGGGLRVRLFRLRAALKQCVKRELEAEGGMA